MCQGLGILMEVRSLDLPSEAFAGTIIAWRTHLCSMLRNTEFHSAGSAYFSLVF